MTKWDIISITIDQLISQWGVSPSKRDQFDTTWVISGLTHDTTIRWDPRASIWSQEDQNAHVPRVVQIVLKKTGYFEGHFECTIIDVADSHLLSRSQKEKIIKTEKHKFIQITKLYRRFKTLEKNIIRYKMTKENDSFLEDLIKVFPSTLSGAILGGDHDD